MGRYQLLEPIGSGPCGMVSRAKVFGVAGFERQFAVKRFHPELTITNALAQALSAAARAYGSLEHPRIARMSEFGVAQGQTFTAVEHVAGLDAARLIAEARLAGMTLAAGGALALISQAARAVGYAHGRGLTHLGLAPTNVLINADGDVKITDFGILAAGMPQRPVDVARLQYRIQYLAPEQVANEATSAATDVFALGVIAYELVTGQRTFRGETPQQVAQSIMAGPPSEPALPRPIVRVLHRCLARSPFERFPDARALADALDAALRVAPVPGTRKDVGAQVKATMDRLLALHESEMSGMVAMNLSQPPVSRQPAPDVPTLGRDSQPAIDPATSEFVRPDTHVPGPSPLVGPATTMTEMPRPTMTMTGLPPPPIPVPPGIVSLGAAPPPPPRDAPHSTLLGIQSKIPPIRPQVPQIPPRPPAPPTTIPTRADTSEPTRERSPTADHLQQRMIEEELSSSALELDDGNSKSILIEPPVVGRTRTRPSDAPTSEMSPLQAAQLQAAAATAPETPLVQVWRETSEFPEVKIENEEAEEAAEQPVEPMFAAEDDEATEPQDPLEHAPMARPAPAVPPVVMGGRPGEVVEGDAKLPSLANQLPPAAKRSQLPLILGAVLVLGGGAAIAAWQLTKSDGSGTESTGSGSATKVVTPPADAAQADAPQIATAEVDAATTKTPGDAGVADARTAAPAIDAGAAVASGGSTDLSITSTPNGARVYLDGADTGVTPLKLPGSPDRHTIALLLAGHDLYIAQVDGHGTFAIPMKEVTPPAGPAGIKVIKCKDKDRYYVFVDGKPTGMMCPTERIETDVGSHTVEVYDAVTEAKKKWDVVVKDTRLSQRVKIE
ncbi:hypothetical protein BH11MYX3_BH11MYX3_24070 [soil metagenome]